MTNNKEEFFCSACARYYPIRNRVIRKGMTTVCTGCIERMAETKRKEAEELKELEIKIKAKVHRSGFAKSGEISPEFREAIARDFLIKKQTQRKLTAEELKKKELKQRKDDMEYERQIKEIESEYL
jgi:hypothetical protein